MNWTIYWHLFCFVGGDKTAWISFLQFSLNNPISLNTLILDIKHLTGGEYCLQSIFVYFDKQTGDVNLAGWSKYWTTPTELKLQQHQQEIQQQQEKQQQQQQNCKNNHSNDKKHSNNNNQININKKLRAKTTTTWETITNLYKWAQQFWWKVFKAKVLSQTNQRNP